MTNAQKSLNIWYNRYEIRLLLFCGSILYVFFMTLIYKDVMKDNTMEKMSSRKVGGSIICM